VAALALVACSGPGAQRAPNRPVAVARPSPAFRVVPAPFPVPASTIPPSTAPAASPPTTVDPPGPPYGVAEYSFPLVDTGRPTVSQGRTISASRSLTTLVFVPSAPGRRPLVVFAHGFQVGPSPYITLLRAWASHGYVVAAPEFPLTDQDVAGANLDEGDINNQPTDVRFVTDWLVSAASPVRARIDESRVAVAGHSDGGETALAAGIAPTPSGEPAFRAVVAMSAQAVTNVPTANPPLLVTQGSADTINPPSLGLQAYALATGPKYLLMLEGGGHLPPLEPGSVWLPGIEAVTETFLDAYVAGGVPVSAIPSKVPGGGLFSLRVGA
jgi:acetyl esterase/lipase